MLRDYPNIRKVAYIVSAVLAIALGAFQVAYAAAGAGQPVWLNVAWPVYSFVAAGLGVTASTNITPVNLDELTDGKGDDDE